MFINKVLVKICVNECYAAVEKNEEYMYQCRRISKVCNANEK